MPSEDLALARLRAALGAVTQADAQALLTEVRAEARARVRAVLLDLMQDSLLQAVEAELHGSATPTGTAVAGQSERPPAAERAQRPTDFASAPLAEPRPPSGTHAGATAPADAPTAPQAGPASTPAPAADDTADAPSATALYVYGVVSPDSAPRLILPDGIDGAPVHAIVEGDVAAVLSEVPLADFAEDRLREHLGDMGWVEATARRHELVLDAISAAVTVIPMRLCTVYETEAGLRRLLHDEADALRQALGWLHGKAEWGVKVFFEQPSDRAQAGGHERGASGAEYMQRRLEERDARLKAARHVEAAATHIHEALADIAADAALSSPQRREASGRANEMVLNGVYLVAEEREDDFHGQIDALSTEFAELGLELETTGPWPAYNFVPGTIGAAW